MSRLSRMVCSKKIRPETGLSSIWVKENSPLQDQGRFKIGMFGSPSADQQLYGFVPS
jgi:hypothetical protein